MGALQAFGSKTMYSDSKEWYLDAYVSHVSENAEDNFEVRRRRLLAGGHDLAKKRIPAMVGWDHLVDEC